MPLPSEPVAGNPYGPLVKFLRADVPPPSSVYVAADDRLVLVSTNLTNFPWQYNLTIRFLRPDGTVEPMEFQVTVPNDGLSHSNAFQTGEGFMLSSTAWNGPNERGLLYSRLYLNRADFVSFQGGFQLLFAGYLQAAWSLSFPGNMLYPVEVASGGWRWVTFANPGAGLGFSTTPRSVGGSVVVGWRLHAILGALTTGAAVANRRVWFQIAPGGGGAFLNTPPQGPILANSFITISAYEGAAPTFDSASQIATLPLPSGLDLVNGETITWDVLNLQAADQLSNLAVLVEERCLV